MGLKGQQQGSTADGSTWQEYTELYKKDLHDPDNHNGGITDLEPDILECKVKWALESITTNKASGGDGIPVELFQILKDDAVKVPFPSGCAPLRGGIVTYLTIEFITHSKNPAPTRA